MAEKYIYFISVVSVITFIVSFIYNHQRVKYELALSIKHDITDEHMRILERKVARFLQNNNIDAGTKIEYIADILNIEEGEIGERFAAQAHLNPPDENGRMIVTFRKGLTATERRFALAHECGHIINNDPLPIDRPYGDNKDLREQAADYIAAALLMPIEDVYNFLTDNDYLNLSSKNKIKLCQKLCKKYNVDNIIVLRRVREVYYLKESILC